MKQSTYSARKSTESGIPQKKPIHAEWTSSGALLPLRCGTPTQGTARSTGAAALAGGWSSGEAFGEAGVGDPQTPGFLLKFWNFPKGFCFLGVSQLFRFLKHGGATLRLEEEPQLLSSHAPLPLAPETAQQAPQAVEMQHAPQADKLLLESSKGRLCSLWPNHGHGRRGKMLGKSGKNLVVGQKAEKKRNSIWPHNMQRRCKTDKLFGKLFLC